MIFKNITAKNFQSFEELHLEFRPGRHLINGPNGVGKSSIVELIPWVLYNKSLRGKDFIMWGKKSCEGTVNFSIQDDDYSVNRKAGKKNSIEMACNESDVTARNTDNIEADLQKTIGIPYDLFISIITVLQGLPINFSLMSPTIRKAMIETIMGLDNWEVIAKLFDNERLTILDVRNGIIDRYNAYKDSIIAKRTELDTIKNSIESNIDEVQDEIRKIKKYLGDLKRTINSTENKREMITDKNIVELRDELDDLATSYTAVNIKISDLETIIDEKVCPTCNRPYPEEQILEAITTRDSYTAKLEKIQAIKDDTQSVFDSVTEINAQLRSLEYDAKNYNQQLESLLRKLEIKSDNKDDVIKELSESLDILHRKIEDLESQLSKHDTDLECVNYINGLLVPSSKFRTAVLEKYLVYINSILEEMSPYILNDTIVSLCVDKRANGIDINIACPNLSKNYKSLSGGEKRRIDIIIILSLQRFLIECSGIKTNILLLDEIFDSLDTGGIQTILDCIEASFPEDMCIYVITHKKDFKQSFSSIINVYNEDGKSRIEYGKA